MNLKALAFLLFLPVTGHALTQTSPVVNLVSHTATADVNVRISSTNPGDVVYAIHIGSCTTTSGAIFSLGDSSGTVVSTIAAISTYGTLGDCPALGTHILGVRLTSAASYQNIGAARVSILIQNENRTDNQ